MNKIHLIFSCLIFLIASCKPDTSYVYEVNDVNVSEEGGSKSHLKSNIEFISIAYQDIFGSPISGTELSKLNLAYSSFGDRKLIEDMIIRNFLNKPGVQIPTKSQMKNDVPKFLDDTYKKFFNRSPNEFEKYQLMNTINNDTTITPELMYYGLMTSDEYRYY